MPWELEHALPQGLAAAFLLLSAISWTVPFAHLFLYHPELRHTYSP